MIAIEVYFQREIKNLDYKDFTQLEQLRLT